MNELLGGSAALTSLVALTHWARTVPTRAWGNGAPDARRARPRAWAVALATVLLQTAAATVATGWAAGVALVPASWMVLGWLLAQSMNQWPGPSLRWAWRLGLASGGVCVLALALHVLHVLPTAVCDR
ncbi:hypothetical protein D5045_03575 [Verminephrobacter eiseniae]|uniref:hypothetical protein n=1 Tax=Verminephrobacter eiseniae TaxID=364317 RepID=UPI002238C251|nr:hypothetical protein [Verminephrobacter eiseniae]MCW5259392.1 hypothetical protein [Verminephrobacter eiseniae]